LYEFAILHKYQCLDAKSDKIENKDIKNCLNEYNNMTIVGRKQCLEEFERANIDLKNEYYKLTFNKARFEPKIITTKEGLTVLKIEASVPKSEKKVEIYSKDEIEKFVCGRVHPVFYFDSLEKHNYTNLPASFGLHGCEYIEEYQSLNNYAILKKSQNKHDTSHSKISELIL